MGCTPIHLYRYIGVYVSLSQCKMYLLLWVRVNLETQGSAWYKSSISSLPSRYLALSGKGIYAYLNLRWQKFTAVDYSKPKYASVDNIKVVILSQYSHLLMIIFKNIYDALWTSRGQRHALLFRILSVLSREGAHGMDGRRNEDGSPLCKGHYFTVAHPEFGETSNQLSHFMLVSSF